MSPERLVGGETLSYLAFQAYRIIGQDASPDGFEGHLSPVVCTLPHICEPPCRVVRIGRLEFNMEDAGVW